MNTNARTLLTLTAGLAVGFLVALAVLDKQPMAPEAVEAGTRALDRAAAPAQVDDELQLASPGAAPGETARAAAEVDVTETPEDERRILHGVVLGPDDEPIAGATIVGYIPTESRSSRGSSGSTYTEPTLEEELAEARRKALASRKRRRIATSGEDGTFRMDLPQSAQGRLRTYLEDYTFEIDRASRSRGSSPEDPMIVRGKPILWLTLDVRLPDGTQPAEARITLAEHSGSTSWGTEWTPEDPKVNNRFGKASVTASAGPNPSTSHFQDASPWRSSEVEVAGTPGEAATIQLEERRRVSIELVDPSADLDAPEPWVRIVKTHLFDPEHPGHGLERHVDFDERPVEIGGRFVYFDVDPGDWTVLAGRGPVDDLLGATNSIQVVVGDGETRCHVEAPPFDPSEYVTITCLDPTGEGLDEVRFTIRHESNGGSSSSGLSGLSRQGAGHYRVAARALEVGSRLSVSGPITTTLTATHADFGAQSVIVKANAPTLTVQFAAPATVDVEIQGYTSGRYWVSVTGSGVGRSAFSSGRDDQGLVDAEGHARVGPVAPGDYTVVLQAAGDSGGHFGRKRLASVEITVRPGENRVSIPLPTLHEVRVDAPGLGEGSALVLELQDAGFRDRHEANVDGSGLATFEGVPAGTYRLRSRGASAPMTIQVPPTSHVFEAKEVNALALSIQDPQGLLGAAGFRNGDIIYGADGTEFTNMVQVQTRFMNLSSGAVEWMVDRGGSTITLRSGPWEGDMRTLAPRLGGSFDPTSR